MDSKDFDLNPGRRDFMRRSMWLSGAAVVAVVSGAAVAAGPVVAGAVVSGEAEVAVVSGAAVAVGPVVAGAVSGTVADCASVVCEAPSSPLQAASNPAATSRGSRRERALTSISNE